MKVWITSGIRMMQTRHIVREYYLWKLLFPLVLRLLNGKFSVFFHDTHRVPSRRLRSYQEDRCFQTPEPMAADGFPLGVS